MTRCKAICVSGLRCKNKTCNEFCGVHDYSITCEKCEYGIVQKERFTLKNCGHSFCKECICELFMKDQWSPEFSTYDDILCPECKTPATDSEFKNLIEILVKDNVLERKIIHHLYLCPELMKKFTGELGHVYSKEMYDRFQTYDFKYLWSQQLKYDCENPEVVYFPTARFEVWNERRCYYASTDIVYFVFKFRDEKVKDLFPALQKELVEYVFHPSRVKLELLDDM